MFDDDVTVPAGWYPDPMGLPQLRWWNNHAWTELTTEARPPLVMQQPTKLMFADDDDLPTRRQQREQRERDEQYVNLATAEDDAGLPNEPAAVFAEPLREIDTIDEPAFTASSVVAEEDILDEGDAVGAAYTPRSATTAVSAPTVQQSQATLDDEDASPRRHALAHDKLPAYTAPVWIIALTPLLQLVVGLLLLLGFGSSLGAVVTGAILGLLYLLVVGLAIGDRALLQRAGYEHTAHWAWAFLGAPVYLIARSVSMSRTGDLGLGPLLVWAALALLQVGSILVVPGQLITVFPAVFSAQAEQSIASDSTVFGSALKATCPDTPPVLVGQEFTCLVADSDESTDVTVRLERVNGWIDWRVTDWGRFTLYR